MRDMVMQMSGSNGVFSVLDEHLPGLVAQVFIGPVVWMVLAGLRAFALSIPTSASAKPVEPWSARTPTPPVGRAASTR